MKISLIILFAFTWVFVPSVFAQSVTVTGKEVTFRRPMPKADYKRSFTINYPKVKAANAALAKQIEKTLAYEKVFDFSIKDELKDSQWLNSADFAVGYNKHGILCVTLTIEGIGAYPSSSSKIIAVNLQNGRRLLPSDLFADLMGLKEQVIRLQKKEIANSIAEIKKDPEARDTNPDTLFKDSVEYTKLTLDEFAISDRGVTFTHDYGFPHALLALQPSGEYFLPWSKLQPYIKRGGLLGRFVR